MKLLAVLAIAVTIQAQAALAESADLDCVYAVRGGEMQTYSHCAWRDGRGHIQLAPEHLRRLAFAPYGLASVYVNGWLYVARDGRSAPVMALDNGADPFSDGLARSPDGEKIGYIDRRLRTVIAARFDGAFPFEHGLAAVCLECRSVAQGEYSSYAGGSWGCIDRHGRFVVALHAAAAYVPCSPPQR